MTPARAAAQAAARRAAAPQAEADMSRALTNTPEYWSDRICAAWQKAVASIIETGQLLLNAKAAGQNEAELKLPFSPQTARKLMAIARHPVICAHVRNLPASWGTLYELTKLPAETLEAKIKDGTITPALERKDVARIGDPKPDPPSLPDIETMRLDAIQAELHATAAGPH